VFFSPIKYRRYGKSPELPSTEHIGSTFTNLEANGHPSEQLIVPIYVVQDNVVVPIGTGFFIQRHGLLMTAAHVVKEILLDVESSLKLTSASLVVKNSTYALFPVFAEGTTDNPTYTAAPIVRAKWLKELDIGICQMAELKLNGQRALFSHLQLSLTLPKPGDDIFAIGYHDLNAPTFEINETTGSSQIHPNKFKRSKSLALGKVIEVYPESRDRGQLFFPCFQTDARFESGMSGGPVFNKAGYVCGIVCSSMFPTEDNPRYISHVSLLWPAMAQPVDVSYIDGEPSHLVSLYELALKKMIEVSDGLDRIFFKKSDNSETVKIFYRR
jgi:hypothetical protein